MTVRKSSLIAQAKDQANRLTETLNKLQDEYSELLADRAELQNMKPLVNKVLQMYGNPPKQDTPVQPEPAPKKPRKKQEKETINNVPEDNEPDDTSKTELP